MGFSVSIMREGEVVLIIELRIVFGIQWLKEWGQREFINDLWDFNWGWGMGGDVWFFYYYDLM